MRGAGRDIRSHRVSRRLPGSATIWICTVTDASQRIQPAAYPPWVRESSDGEVRSVEGVARGEENQDLGRTSQNIAYGGVDGDASRGYITHNVGKSVSG